MCTQFLSTWAPEFKDVYQGLRALQERQGRKEGARPVMLMLTSQPHTPERGVFGPKVLAPVYQAKVRERRPEGNMAATSISV